MLAFGLTQTDRVVKPTGFNNAYLAILHVQFIREIVIYRHKKKKKTVDGSSRAIKIPTRVVSSATTRRVGWMSRGDALKYSSLSGVTRGYGEENFVYL